MPHLRPESHQGFHTNLIHSNTAKHAGRLQPVTARNVKSITHKYSISFDGGPGTKNGLYVREADGSYTYYVWSYDQALNNGYADEDIFVVGRDGYYLTMEEARNAMPSVGPDSPKFVHGIHYVDDFNDEYQDFYICAEDGVIPEPYEEAHAHEPIQ